MDWTRGPTIGRGSTATVSLATTSGDPFAVKSTELSNSNLLQKEQNFLSKLASPYIIKYMGFNITSENNQLLYNLFMEYAPGGTLHDLIQRNGGKLEESMIRSHTKNLLHGLDYLHNLCGVVHCDIKSQNVLIHKNNVKLADFGCAKLVNSKSEFSGTPVFMAPEVARGEDQGFKADIWSLGCLIIEMATGRLPWRGLIEGNCIDPVSVLYKIGFSDEIPEIPIWLSEKGKDFISKCLSRDPEKRWSAKELLDHEFLDGIDQLGSKESESVSPSCVLDHSFWDSMDCQSQSSSHNQSLTRVNVSSGSPVERIEGLITDLPNWDSGDDWINVRATGNKEESESDTILAQDDFSALMLESAYTTELQLNMVQTRLDSFQTLLHSIPFEDEVESSVIDNDLLFEFNVADMISNDFVDNSSSFIVVSTIQNFEMENDGVSLFLVFLCLTFYFEIFVRALQSRTSQETLARFGYFT